jgi:asparagine synthase (glutamine-hydrolysing)
MAVSLEARVPFLDHRFVELALQASERALFSNGLKSLEKAIFADLLPAEILARRKEGFAGPAAAWMLTPGIRAMARDLLVDHPDSWCREWFKTDVLRAVIDSPRASRAERLTVWALVVFGLWHRAHLGSDIGARAVAPATLASEGLHTVHRR